jgi:hypothetical protein
MRLFFHKVSIIFNTLLPTMSKTLYANVVTIPASASEHITKTVFQFIVICKMASWVHNYNPEMKRIHGKASSEDTRKKFIQQPSVGKIMAYVFWDKEQILCEDFLETGTTIKSKQYKKTLNKL